MHNYDNVVAIDEATKRFMGFLNEDISASINDGIMEALRHTNSDIEQIQERINTVQLSVKENMKLTEAIKVDEILSKLDAIDRKVNWINDVLVGQDVLLESIGRLEKEIKFLKQPFYKRWFRKEVK